MIATRITTQISPSAFISPLGECIIWYNSPLNLLMGLILAKNSFEFVSALRVSVSLNIRSKNGLSNASETTDNNDDKILKLKYAKISFGYFEMYLKMDRKLFIYICGPGCRRD